MSGLVGALEWHKPLLVGLMYTPELKHPGPQSADVV